MDSLRDLALLFSAWCALLSALCGLAIPVVFTMGFVRDYRLEWHAVQPPMRELIGMALRDLVNRKFE